MCTQAEGPPRGARPAVRAAPGEVARAQCVYKAQVSGLSFNSRAKDLRSSAA